MQFEIGSSLQRLKNHVSEYHVGFADIITRSVATFYNYDFTDLKKCLRNSEYHMPRHIAIFLTRKYTQLSMNEIGEYFGGRSYSHILQICKNIEKKIEEDFQLERTVNLIEMSLFRFGW